ncbi:hypothetical protein EV368DRAFT_89583, partial [Lentinula lateritia]
NKKVLKERIAGFSQDKSHWQHLLPNARRAHRGVRDGGITKNRPQTNASPAKVKKLKPSVLRRNELMGLPLHTPLGAQLFASEHSKDMRTLEEKNSLLRLAKEFDDAHPYIPCEELARRKKAREEEQAKEKVDSKVAVAENLRSMTEQIATLMATIQILSGLSLPLKPPYSALATLAPFPVSSSRSLPPNPLQTGLTPSHMIHHHSSSSTTGVQVGRFTPSQLLVPPVPPHISAPSPFGLSQNFSSGVVVPPPTVNAGAATSSMQKERFDELTVGHGQVICYKYREVREPRQISFVTDIARLDRVWDDEQPNWDPVDCGSLLEINGAPIALKYWKQVFSRKNDGAWSWLKRLWVEWKYVAERYRSSSSEQFWQEFSSSNGERFHWKAITNRLRDLRSERDQQLVDQAKAEYGDNFAKVFVNNRGNVLTDKPTITRHYRVELAKRSI